MDIVFNLLDGYRLQEDYFKYRLFKDTIDHISMSWSILSL